MEIAKMLTISTAHITAETATKLDLEPNTDEMQLSVYRKSDYGWMIWVNFNLDNCNATDDLRKCLELAKANNCEWLCLDCDGEIVDELDKYEW